MSSAQMVVAVMTAMAGREVMTESVAQQYLDGGYCPARIVEKFSSRHDKPNPYYADGDIFALLRDV